MGLEHLKQIINWELDDLQARIDWLRNRVQKDEVLGAGHGASIDTSKLNVLIGMYQQATKNK